MTDISLPYDQVCLVIRQVAYEWDQDIKAKRFGRGAAEDYLWFGHALWRALEEAHLAKLDQTGESS